MNKFLVIDDKNLDTGKTYRHNFQGMNYESENCMFYVWHKKEIKLVESKNLGSTMSVFFVKDNELDIKNINEDIMKGIMLACHIFSAFDEDSGQYYFFLPYFSTKQIDYKNQIFDKLNLKIRLSNTSKGVILDTDEQHKETLITNLSLEGKIGFLFGLTLLYGKFDSKGENLSSIKIQIPLFGQFLTVGEDLKKIQQAFQENGIFIQISENIQGEKNIYEITSNDYELLSIFAKLYISVENLTQITKRKQAQEASEALSKFCKDDNVVDIVKNSCVKILQKI